MRPLQVFQQAAGRAHQQGHLLEPQTLQVRHPELRFKQFGGPAGFKVPSGHRRWFGLQGLRELQVFRNEHLSRADALQFAAHGFQNLIAFQLRTAKFTGGNIHKGEAGALLRKNHRCQVIVASAGQEVGFREGARRDHPYNFALEEAIGLGLGAGLFTDRYMEAAFNQAAKVVFSGMVGDARHGHTHAFGHRAAGEHDIQGFAGLLRVFVEGFVKIAQAEEDDRLGVFAFDLQVLLAQRGDRIAHARLSRSRLVWPGPARPRRPPVGVAG